MFAVKTYLIVLGHYLYNTPYFCQRIIESSHHRTITIMQLSLLTYYRKKPEPLRHLILSLQESLQKKLGDHFRPYQIEQVHATLLGLESFLESGHRYSHWYRKNIGAGQPIDFRGLLNRLQTSLPDMQIQIGGYEARRDHGFLSRGDHPYPRSFSFQLSTAVVVGWPVTEREGKWSYSEQFYQLRHAFEQHYLCHKWHKDGYRDNDCYLVLGKIDRAAIGEEVLAEVSREIRTELAKTPVRIPFSREFLTIVVYENPELPLKTTRFFPLEELGEDPSPFLKFLNNS